MKIIVTLALISILAVPVFAGLDQDSDMMGLYFDPGGNVVCVSQVLTFTHVPLYVLYTNPTQEAVRGFECGITATDVTNTGFSIGAMPTGYANAGTPTNLIVTYDSPVLTSAATVLAELDVFYIEFGNPPMFFYLGASSPSSNPNGMPMIMKTDLSMKSVGTSVASGKHAAAINGGCDVVADESASFGAVKALFR